MKEFSPEQVAKMRPEARERYENRLKIVKRNRKILKISCIVFAAVVLILTLSMTVLFNISSIEVVEAGKKYNANEIIMASGLNVGDNMVRTNFKKVEERIEKGLPYVYDAVIEKTITGKVTITITDAKPKVLIKTSQGYVIADEYGKILQMTASKPEDNTLMFLHLKNGITATVGEVFTFDNADEQALFDELVSYLKALGLYGGITDMTLTNRASIELVYENRLRLLLGSSDKLEEKIKSAAEVIKRENQQDPELIAEVNLTIPKKVFVNPLESLDEQEEADVPLLNDIEGESTTGTGSQNSEGTASAEGENEEEGGEEADEDEVSSDETTSQNSDNSSREE